MLINWFTVFAQILNFLILVALLWRFLYKPILRVIHKRQALIDTQWQAAQQAQAEAQQQALSYQQQLQELQHQQQALLTEAQVAAEQERQRLLTQIRQDLERLRANWQEELHQEQEGFTRRLKGQVISQTCAITRKALRDLANQSLEQQMMGVFCDRLRHLDDRQKQAIAQALHQSPQSILVCSHFDLSPELRQHLIDTLHAEFAVDAEIKFITAPDLLCGIEVKLPGQELVWSLDTYLQTLEQQLSTALTQKGASHYEQNLQTGAGCLP
ncbi:F0F1 ATP synthase subunit B [Fischerella thermalis CCMEE 5330]|uniref:ATP synthase subunit b n=1 Tax=Fischerella thermalis CCMEE 5330 TaxID=2019670 RepID=A0A2N6MHX3_9CYAN|nr:F0F1 ATP synthase subunit B [Fischerella thermalis]PMB46370.1 F0F1 ATP synthase subunit B [Fischerella thermalis CCMEE 5330]